MITLNLETKNGSQRRIKEYLEHNASEILANKINNGVRIEKDGKTLISKKDLDGFWSYACKKARESGDDYTEDETVFRWAVHYFEEDEIEGTLYNEDGSKYEIPKPVYKPATPPVITTKPKPPKAQMSLFDMMEKAEEKVDETEEPDEETTTDLKVDTETGEILQPITIKKPEPVKQLSPMYQKYIGFQTQYPQAVIAYRLGDFFEVFGDNAVMISNELELTLTGRDCGLEERVPMIGFPFHASDNYFKKIAEKHELVVVDNNVATHYSVKEETETEIYFDEDAELAEMRKRSKAFETSALCKLMETFGDELTIQEGDI